MHEGAFKFIESTVAQLDPRHSVIELGSRTVAGDWPYSGPVRPLFGDVDSYVGVDIAPGPNVDVVADAAIWPFYVFTDVDTVVCCETLEHTPVAEAICANAHRLLKVGGVFLLTAAGEGRAPHSAVDGGPLRAVDSDGMLEFYRNVSRDDLRRWLRDFGVVLIDTDTPGDIYGLAVKC
jgi:SAM-dependent methyltransferase